jgi:hypothetical protein
MSRPPRTVGLLLPFLLLTGAAPAPAPDVKTLDAQLQAVRAAKPAERPALAQELIKEHVRLSESLLAEHKYPAAVDTLRKARGLITAYVPGPVGQQLGGELDVRVTLAQWREKNDGRGLHGEYYENKDFTNKLAEHVDAKVDFPWLRGFPIPNLDGEGFAARWTGVIVAPRAGAYKLVANHDDGCRIWVDDVPVLDAWQNGGAASEGFVEFTAKPQAIRVEFYNYNGPAHLSLHWVPPGQELASAIPPDVYFIDKEAATRLAGKPMTAVKGFGLAAEYFDGEFGRRVFARVDPDINFCWFRTHPHPAMGEAFSIRWSGFLRAPKAGRYRIAVTVDDGCRIYLDQKLVLSRWVQNGVWDTTVELTGKPQALIVEYNNRAGDAKFGLTWQLVGADLHPTPIPPSAFFTDKATAQYAPMP